MFQSTSPQVSQIESIPSLREWEFGDDSGRSDDARDAAFTEVWNDEAALAISRTNGAEPVRYRLDFAGLIAIDVVPHERRIISRGRASDFPRQTFDHLLADQVVPRILSHEGQFVLHAGAVRHDKRAILLMGESGSGKSTLAASFNRRGYSLLSDDALALSWSDGIPFVKAVYPSLRLLPDSVAALFPTSQPSEPVAHYGSKRRLPVSIDELHCADALPVSAMIALGSPTADGSILMRRLNPAEACMALVANSFALDPADLGRAASKLRCACRFAAECPTYELNYPRDFARLPEVQAAIIAELD